MRNSKSAFKITQLVKAKTIISSNSHLDIIIENCIFVIILLCELILLKYIGAIFNHVQDAIVLSM